MKIYTQLMKELDSAGAHYSRDLSDVDLSDPDDVKATVTDPNGAVLVHLGRRIFWSGSRSTSRMCRSGERSSRSWNRWTCDTNTR